MEKKPDFALDALIVAMVALGIRKHYARCPICRAELGREEVGAGEHSQSCPYWLVDKMATGEMNAELNRRKENK